MSDTPRVDAEAFTGDERNLMINSHEYVTAFLARQLERELAEANAKLAARSAAPQAAPSSTAALICQETERPCEEFCEPIKGDRCARTNKPITQRPYTDAPKQDFGPWRIVDGNNDTTLYSADFEHDVTISINGDFADAAQRIAYAEDVARRLTETGADK